MEKKSGTNQILLFKLDSTSEKYGEVLEIHENRVKIRELLKPEDLQGNLYSDGRHVFCGDRELFRTTKIQEIPLRTVISWFPLCSLSDYHSTKGFLLRQTYDQSTQYLHPDLPKVCLCKENLNPDLNFFICASCGGVFHHSCVGGDVCPDCKLPSKRAQIENIDIDSPSKLPKLANRQDSSLPLDVDKYKTLGKQSRDHLNNAIRTVHMNYLAIQSSLGHDDKTRQQILAKIKCALLLAYEETKEFERFEISMNRIDSLAVSIEAAIYFSTGQNVKSPEYSKKIRSVMFNLTAEKNPDFRGGIIKGEIDPKDICRMQSKDMASSEIKNFRQERQKVYTKEQLILPESSKKLVVKTRKGEAVIDVNEQFVSDEFNTDILDSISKKRDTDRHETDDDPFNPNNYESGKNGQEDAHDNQIADMVKEWGIQAIMNKIRDKLMMTLASEQSERILSRINAVKLNKDS
jgi:hypothetical protein